MKKAKTKHAVSRAIRDELGEYTGSGLDDRLRYWARVRPDIVTVATVDDTHFCSSTIGFVAVFDKDDDSLHGCWAYYVGQCDLEEATWFVYPEDADSIRMALDAMFGPTSTEHES